MKQDPKQPSWKIRRRVVAITIAFCMGVIGFVLWNDMDSESAQTAVNMAFVILGSTVSSYVFGAAWQDVQIGKDSGYNSED